MIYNRGVSCFCLGLPHHLPSLLLQSLSRTNFTQRSLSHAIQSPLSTNITNNRVSNFIMASRGSDYRLTARPEETEPGARDPPSSCFLHPSVKEITAVSPAGARTMMTFHPPVNLHVVQNNNADQSHTGTGPTNQTGCTHSAITAQSRYQTQCNPSSSPQPWTKVPATYYPRDCTNMNQTFVGHFEIYRSERESIVRPYYRRLTKDDAGGFPIFEDVPFTPKSGQQFDMYTDSKLGSDRLVVDGSNTAWIGGSNGPMIISAPAEPGAWDSIISSLQPPSE